MTHPTIELFQQRAELLDLQGSKKGLDDAIADLAAWIGLAADHLSEDDLAFLGRLERSSTERGSVGGLIGDPVRWVAGEV